MLQEEKSEPLWPINRMCDYFLFIYEVASQINGSRTFLLGIRTEEWELFPSAERNTHMASMPAS